MSEYLIYNEETLPENDPEVIGDKYNHGFQFGRKFRGYIYQTRSLRVNLSQFELNSENRRVLRKFPDLKIEMVGLPYPDYSWQIHQLGKEFYEQRFGAGVMSASKIKELFTQPHKNNFNVVLRFSENEKVLGYVVCYSDGEILHYAYPFYQLDLQNSSLGIAMMTMAIDHLKQQEYKYVYLGTAADSSSKYKLQFSGLQWWEQENSSWSENLEELKDQLK